MSFNYDFDCYFSKNYVILIRNTVLSVYKLKYVCDDPKGNDSAVVTPTLINSTKFTEDISRETYVHVLLRSGIFAKSITITKHFESIYKITSNRGYILIDKDIFTAPFRVINNVKPSGSVKRNPFA